MISPDYSKVKHLNAVKIAVANYRKVYAQHDWTQASGRVLKQAEIELNETIEAALMPH